MSPRYLSDRIGAEFRGRIAGVSRAGAFVRLDETGADGLVPISTLGSDYFRHDPASQTLTGERTGRVIGLGQTVTVRLREAAPITGGLILELLSVEGAKPRFAPARRWRTQGGARSHPQGQGSAQPATRLTPGARNEPPRRRFRRQMETYFDLVGRDANSIAWWQMCIRAVIVFLWAVILYRVLPRRAFGSNAALDIVIVVILGSSLSRTLTGNAPVLPALAATAILALLYSVLSLLARRFGFLSRLVKGKPIRLIHDGEVDRQALRRAQLGEGDLKENLRLKGIGDPGEVAEAFLERNGEFSVIKKA